MSHHPRSGPRAARRRERRLFARAHRRNGVALLACGILSPLAVHAQDLRYGITPTAQQVTWDDALGLDNTLLWGGRLGFVFGRRIELQGFYLTNTGSDARIRDLYDRLNLDETPPQNQNLGVRNYGAALAYNFSVGGFTPFLRAGGSVLRFEPQGRSPSDRIALSYGGGLRFGKPGGLRFNLFAEDLRFRLDRNLLLALPATGVVRPADPDANKLRSNLTYGAGLTVPLGGGAATYDDTPQYQLSNVSLPVDVFAGRLDFADASGLPRQYVLGARTGIDFGPLVGLRAFYWRGVNDNFNRQQGIQGYGGEAQFSLNAGPGISPFLVAGAAQIDFLSSYQAGTGGAAITRPGDQTALILGGGARIPLGSRLTLTAAARDYLMAVNRPTQNVSETSQLRSNWQYSVGLSFGLGGRGLRRRVAERPRTDTVFVDRRTGERVTSAGEVEGRVVEGRDVDVRAQERTDAVAVERFVVTTTGDTLRGTVGDSVLAADRTARLVEVRRPMRARTGGTGVATGEGASTGYASDRTIEVVVPTEGEINIRYGPQRVAPAAPAAPSVTTVRTFEREFRDPQGRTVREFREPDGQLSREWRAESGRTIREYRDPGSGRLVREYVPVPSTSYIVPAPAPAPTAPGGTAYAPASTPEYVPGYAPPLVRGTAEGRLDRDLADARVTSTRTPVRKQGELATAGDATSAAGTREAELSAAAAARSPEASAEELRAIVREELARDQRARDERLRVLEEQVAAARAAGTTAVAGTTTTSVETQTVRTERPEPPRTYFGGNGVQGGMLYSGATFAGGAQALAGARLDFGALSQRVPGFRLVPELAFGFGNGGTSTYVAANAMYEFGQIARLRPRVSAGAGLLNFGGTVGGRDGMSVVLTPAYGVSLPLSRFGVVAGRTPELVVEHQGVDLFDVNRLVIGIGWRR